MAYGTKYTLYMTSSQSADVYKVLLKKNGYEGEEVSRNVPFSPFIPKKDKAAYVRGTSLLMRIREEVDFEFLEFYTNDPREWLVEYYKNDVLIWTGYIVPQQYQAPYKTAPNNITILATDGLGLLKNESFTLTGRNSELTTVRHCIDKIALNLGYAIAISMRPKGQATDRAVLAQVYSDAEIYENKNCYEVLEDILKKYDADITQVNGLWHIIRSLDRKTDRMLYTYDGTYEDTESGPVTYYLMTSLAQATSCRPVGMLNHTLVPGGKQVTIKHDFGRKDTLLSNGNFVDYSSSMFVDWTKTGASFNVYQRDLDGKKYAFLDSNHASDKYIEQSVPIENVADQYFVVSILVAAFGYEIYGGLWKSLPVNIRMDIWVEDGSHTYYLKKENVWGADGVTNTLTYSTTSSIGAPNFNEVKIITDEIPISSGNLHVRLYATKMTIFGDRYYLGCAFADCFLYFLNNGQKYPSSVSTACAFDNSKEPNILPDITLLAGNAPDLANAGYLYRNILRISDGTPITDWNIDGDGTDYTLTQLMAKTLASNNRVARQKLTGTVRGASLAFDSIIKHEYNSDREFEITECEHDPFLETYNVVFEELLAWSSETVTYTETSSLGSSASTRGDDEGSSTVIIMTGDDILNKLLEVDGDGSGLDADLLDGEHGSYYAPIEDPVFQGVVKADHIGEATEDHNVEFDNPVKVNGNIESTGDIIAYVS